MLRKILKAFDAYFNNHRVSLIILILGLWLLLIREHYMWGLILVLIGVITPKL